MNYCTNAEYMTISKHTLIIASSFIIILGLSLIMVVFGLKQMQIMESKLDIITKEHTIKSELMMAVRHGIYERQVGLRNIMLMEDPFERDEGKSMFNRYAVKIITARNKFAQMPLNEKEKEILSEINVAMVKAYKAQMSIIETSIYEEEKKITKSDLEKAFHTQKDFMGKVMQMIMLQKEATKQSVLDAEQSYEAAKTSVYVLGGSALLIGIFIALFVIRLTESQARDVKEAISEIEKSYHLLEERVEKRTHQLALARDEALASNKAKDIFLANMSHELRTPLNIILGYSELLAEVAEEDGSKKIIPDLNKIKKAAHHQLELVNSILDISKIEEGKLDIHAVDFDVETVISEVEIAVKPLMLKNNNTFNINCMYGIGMMYSDNLRIHQILLNLLSNAAKFTKQGQVELTISKDENGDNIEFKVKDSGIGISEKYMEHIFDKFTQADSSTTRNYGGSGLGLSISKQLTQLLKGELSVMSEEEKGTCFTLKLPVIYTQ